MRKIQTDTINCPLLLYFKRYVPCFIKVYINIIYKTIDKTGDISKNTLTAQAYKPCSGFIKTPSIRLNLIVKHSDSVLLKHGKPQYSTTPTAAYTRRCGCYYQIIYFNSRLSRMFSISLIILILFFLCLLLFFLLFLSDNSCYYTA